MTEAFLFGGISSAKVSEPSSRQKKCLLCTTNVENLEILSKCARIPPSFAGGMNGLTLPLEGGGEGGGDSFWLRLRRSASLR